MLTDYIYIYNGKRRSTSKYNGDPVTWKLIN